MIKGLVVIFVLFSIAISFISVLGAILIAKALNTIEEDK